MRDDEAQVGMEVILGKHDSSRGLFGSSNFCHDMNKYVGTTAVILQLNRLSLDGFLYADVNTNPYHWRVVNLQSVGYKSVSSPDTIPVCIKCGLPNPYAEPTSTYICGTCRGWKEALR